MCRFGNPYQATYAGLHQRESGTCAPSQTVVTSECPPQSPTSCDDSVTSITGGTHLPTEPIDPSAMMAHAHPFDQNRASQIPSTPENTSVSSSPTSPLASSSRSDSSGFGSEGDSDSLPPSDHDEDYRPARATSSRSQRRRGVQAKAKPTPRLVFPSPLPPPNPRGAMQIPALPGEHVLTGAQSPPAIPRTGVGRA